MGKKNEEKILVKKYIIMLICVVTLIFCVLYADFIFGDAAYLYSDVGMDTLGLYYPNQIFCSDEFREGTFAQYSLQYGLGKSIDRIWTAYFNPFDWIIFLCTENTMHIGFLIVTYVKYIVIALFSFLYFRKLVDCERVSFLGSLLWTFCSYVVIWGQHYQFLTLMTLFTITMYYLHDMVTGKYRTVPLLVMSYSFLLITSYYFYYMIGIFSALYVIGYHIMNRTHWKQCFFSLLRLAGLAGVSICIGAFSFLPKFSDFLCSARGMSTNDIGIIGLYDIKQLIQFLCDLLSANTLGVGNEYKGMPNYYESAKLFVSVLFVFSLVYHFVKKRVNIIYTFVLSIVCLVLPVVSMLLTGSTSSFRWTFLLCFLMCISIVYMLRDYMNDVSEVKINRKVSMIAGVVYLFLIAAAVIYSQIDHIELKTSAVVIVGIFAALYFITIGDFANLNLKRIDKFNVLLVLCAIEIVCSNFSSINNREIVKRTSLQSELYRDKKTIAALDSIKQNDSGLYRTTKVDSVAFNDALIQKYNGINSYNSVNSQNLVDFCNMNEIEWIVEHPNFVSIGYNETVITSLLSCKYLIGDMNLEQFGMYQNKDLYNVNTWSLPFGYIYTEKIKSDEYAELSKNDKNIALTNAFYFTNGVNESRFENEINKEELSGDITANFNKLQDRGVKNAKLDGHIYTADIPEDISGMLCIPIIYDKQWEVFVDGKKRETFNINGGLMGVNIAKGDCNIKMKYNTAIFDISGFISLCSFALFCVTCFLLRKIQRKGNV